MLDGTFPIRTLYSDVDAFDPRTALRTDLIGTRHREVTLRTEPAVAGLIAHAHVSARMIHKSDGGSNSIRSGAHFEPKPFLNRCAPIRCEQRGRRQRGKAIAVLGALSHALR